MVSTTWCSIARSSPASRWSPGWRALPPAPPVATPPSRCAIPPSTGHEELVAEQWWTTVYLNTTCDPVGPALPDHAFPDEARQYQAGTFTIAVDDDMARRYAEVSNDWSAPPFRSRRSEADRLRPALPARDVHHGPVRPGRRRRRGPGPARTGPPGGGAVRVTDVSRRGPPRAVATPRGPWPTPSRPTAPVPG